VLDIGSATCKSDVVAPISANPLIVSHSFNINNAAIKVSVSGTDVMGACVDPTVTTSVDSCTAESFITVSSSDCSYPVIVIVDQAAVFTSPRTSHRSVQLDLHALININCATTLLNTKVWSTIVCINVQNCSYTRVNGDLQKVTHLKQQGM